MPRVVVTCSKESVWVPRDANMWHLCDQLWHRTGETGLPIEGVTTSIPEVKITVTGDYFSWDQRNSYIQTLVEIYDPPTSPQRAEERFWQMCGEEFIDMRLEYNVYPKSVKMVVVGDNNSWTSKVEASLWGDARTKAKQFDAAAKQFLLSQVMSAAPKVWEKITAPSNICVHVAK